MIIVKITANSELMLRIISITLASACPTISHNSNSKPKTLVKILKTCIRQLHDITVNMSRARECVRVFFYCINCFFQLYPIVSVTIISHCFCDNCISSFLWQLYLIVSVTLVSHRFCDNCISLFRCYLHDVALKCLIILMFSRIEIRIFSLSLLYLDYQIGFLVYMRDSLRTIP